MKWFQVDKIQASVEKELLEHEKQALKDIKATYNKALQDISERAETLQANILNLQNIDTSTYDEKQLEIFNSQVRSKVYQLEYQKMLEKQTSSIIEMLKQDTISNVHTFLNKVYQDSYLGIQYDINMKGIPITVPIKPKTVVGIINKKIEDMTFADRINVNMNDFKKIVKSEISRGLANGSTYNEIARNLSMVTSEDLYKSTRIVITECARVSTEAKLESIREMNKKGADLVKQWDSTLDNKTRDTHAKLDQQYAEVDEPFKVDGYEVMGPGMFGSPKQDCNCRCVLLSVPRWDIEDTVVKYDNEKKKLVEVKNYQEWKKGIIKRKEIQNYLIITNEWLKKATPNSHKVVDMDYFEYKGIKYEVDGEKVVFDYSKHEKEVAEWLENVFGGEIYMLPRVNRPQGIMTSDFLWNNEHWDLKDINGIGKNILFHAVEDHERQAHNFIFDITKSKLNTDEILERLEKLYSLKKINWLDKVIIKRNDEVIIITKINSPSY